MEISNRLKSQECLNRYLRRIIGIDRTAVAPDEVLPLVEDEIQRIAGRRRFGSSQEECDFIDNLRMVCMLYWLLSEVSPRRKPHSTRRARHAIKMRRLAEESIDRSTADALNHLANRALWWETFKIDRETWEQKEAYSNLALELDLIFGAHGIKHRWHEIFSLLTITFGAARRRSGSDIRKFLDQRVRRAKDKRRQITLFFDLNERYRIVHNPGMEKPAIFFTCGAAPVFFRHLTTLIKKIAQVPLYRRQNQDEEITALISQLTRAVYFGRAQLRNWYLDETSSSAARLPVEFGRLPA